MGRSQGWQLVAPPGGKHDFLGKLMTTWSTAGEQARWKRSTAHADATLAYIRDHMLYYL
jgi:hypothetical protein